MFKALTSLEVLTQIIRSMRVMDAVDILIVAYLIYHVIELLRDSRAGLLMKGIFGIVLIYLLAKVLQLRAVGAVIQLLITYGVIALLVVFQPELRKMLEQLGRTSFSFSQLKKTIFRDGFASSQERSALTGLIRAVCDAAASLSRDHIGALIVIERNTKLGDIIATGTLVEAAPSAELIRNIFFPNSPLHDGAIVVRGARIHAAACFLPLSSNYDISRTLGTRHRAALGMSEVSDALVVVVSEESGAISVARDGRLNLRLTVNSLNRLLIGELIPPEAEGRNAEGRNFFWRKNHEKQ